MGFVRVGGGDEVLHLEAHSPERRRPHRNRLRRRAVFAGHFTDRDRFFVHAEHRLTGDAIQNVHVADFTRLREGRGLLSLHGDIEQHRRR